MVVQHVISMREKEYKFVENNSKKLLPFKLNGGKMYILNEEIDYAH